VHVDEPRRDDETAHVERPPGGAVDAADRHDSSRVDPHVRIPRRRAAAVTDPAAAQDEVEHAPPR